MAAYLVGHITVKDEDLWQHYVAGVKDSLSTFESNVIFRGKLVSTLAGSHDHDRVVVIEFANHETLDEWFNSDNYQSLIPLRNRAADMVLTTYDS